MNDPQNPYDAPQAQVQAERIAQLVTASRPQRLVNYLIDSLACASLIMLAITIYSGNDPAVLKDMQEQANPLRDWGLMVGALLLYYVPMEGIFGVTLGKLVTSTRVVDEQGRPPSWGQVFGRTFARMIPMEVLTILLSGNERVTAWHDRLPKTLVVRAR